MCWCHVSCNILSQYLSHNTFGFKGEQNSKRVTKKFLSFFVCWSIHVSRMHMSHFVLSCSNPNALQVAWNVGCFVSSTIQRCLKKVAFSRTISRRCKKKHSPTAGCTKYIRPTTFSPCYRANQTFFQIFQTWSTGKSVWTTFCPFAFWALYTK